MWGNLDVSNLDVLTPYIESALERNLLYYNLNPFEFIAFKTKGNLFKIENNTLHFGWHGVIGARFLKLYFPPIHLYGDEEIEREAVLKATNEGCSLWIEKEHSKALGVKAKTISEYRGAYQPIYHRDYQLAGKKYKNMRRDRNILHSLIESGELEFVFDYPLKGLTGLNNAWLSQTGRKRSVFDFCLQNEKHLTHRIKNLTLLNRDGEPITSSLYAIYSPDKWHCIGAISDYGKIPIGGLQRQSDLYLFELEEKVNLVMVGGYSYKELKFSKLALPHSVYRLGTLPSNITVTKDIWESFRPKPQTYFGV